MSNKMTGLVKWFNPEKGCWFHHAERWQQRCVCPFLSSMRTTFKTLTENQEVEFGIENGPKGPPAVHVVAL